MATTNYYNDLVVTGGATFSDTVTLSNGSLILGGTGRIQGIDTITLGTDAVNKNYVDNAIAGVPQGTVTGTGVDNRLAIWNGTTAIDSDSDFYVDGDTIFTTNLEATTNVSASVKVITPEIESSGTILLDAAADITIDAGGQDIILSDDGTIFGTISNSSGLQIRSRVNDADMFLRGVDGGSEFNALTLDMSEAGAATFNDSVTIGDIPSVGSDTNKFLMSNGGLVSFATGSEVLSYIGAGTGSGSMSSWDIDTALGTASTVSNGDEVTLTSSANNLSINNSGLTVTLDLASSISVTNTITCGSDMTVGDELTVDTINNDTDAGTKFLVHASGDKIKYRTAAEVLSDIGAGTGSGSMSSWTLAGDSGTTAISNGNTATIAGGTNITTSESAGTVTINNSITNNNQLTNGAGYTTNTGTVTGSGASGRVTYWNGTSSVTSDSDLTFDGSDLTIGGDLSVNGGDISTNQVKTISNAASQSTLKIGDVDDGDAITQIDFKAQANTNMSLADDSIQFNSSAINLPSGSSTLMNGYATHKEYVLPPMTNYQANGETISLYSTSVTAGQIYSLSNAFAGWEETDADDDNTTNMLGIALGTSSGNGMLLRGVIRWAGHGFTAGRPLYVSNTPGEFTATAPTSSSNYVRVIGYVINSNTIFFCPDNTWVQRPA